jgi:hypothetical protein
MKLLQPAFDLQSARAFSLPRAADNFFWEYGVMLTARHWARSLVPANRHQNLASFVWSMIASSECAL